MKFATLFLITSFFLTVNLSLSAQLKVGEAVDYLSVLSYDENDISLEDMEDESGLLVVFTSLKCKIAKSYHKKLQSIYTKYSPQGFPVLAIDISSDPVEEMGEAIFDMISSDELEYLYAVDPDKDVYGDFFGNKKIIVPYAVLLVKEEEEDEMLWKIAYMGAIDDVQTGASSATKNYVMTAIAKNIPKRTSGLRKKRSFDNEDKKKKKKSSDNRGYETKVVAKRGCSSNKL